MGELELLLVIGIFLTKAVLLFNMFGNVYFSIDHFDFKRAPSLIRCNSRVITEQEITPTTQ